MSVRVGVAVARPPSPGSPAAPSTSQRSSGANGTNQAGGTDQVRVWMWMRSAVPGPAGGEHATIAVVSAGSRISPHKGICPGQLPNWKRVTAVTNVFAHFPQRSGQRAAPGDERVADDPGHPREAPASAWSTAGQGGHEQVVFCQDPQSGLRAIIAIYSTALGPSLGGTRFYPYPSEDAALADALNLSRAMAYKNALAGLDLGGGKAVIIGDPRGDTSEALLRAYGRFVHSLGGRYITACDIGTYSEDMDILAPCAMGGTLDDENVAVLTARIVCGGANNQLAHPGIEKMLADRGILYAPDYVVNAGGVVQVADELAGFNFERAKARAAGIFTTTKKIFALADEEGVPPAVAADRLAERRMAEVGRLRGIWLGP